MKERELIIRFKDKAEIVALYFSIKISINSNDCFLCFSGDTSNRSQKASMTTSKNVTHPEPAGTFTSISKNSLSFNKLLKTKKFEIRFVNDVASNISLNKFEFNFSEKKKY